MINTFIHGDAEQKLSEMSDGIVDCCVTSPPYYGLRDYGVDGQIGLEETPEQYINKLVSVFSQVRRVLKNEGTLWLNIGDSYARNGGSGMNYGWEYTRGYRSRVCKRPEGLKEKDLIGIPWMLAFALRADGWYLRQDIIWHKPNPMPESVTDRCTKSHEYIFLLSKSQKYYFDHESIMELSVCSENRPSGVVRNREYKYNSKQNNNPQAYNPKNWNGSEFHKGKTGEHQLGRSSKKRGEFNGKTNDLPGREAFRAITEMRNKRDVWTVSTKPLADAHFATFPQDLIVPCILAGCPENGVVLDPFSGAGTTAIVSRKLDRNFIAIELNEKYIEISDQRIMRELGLFATTNANFPINSALQK